jgi:hypothetical protein
MFTVFTFGVAVVKKYEMTVPPLPTTTTTTFSDIRG